MTYLSMIDDACARLSLVQPSSIETSTDQQVLQLGALLNQQGREMMRNFNWQVLTKEMTFVTVAAAAQPAAVPSDWDRFIPNSFYNRSTRRPVFGPVAPIDWQAIQARQVLSLVYLSYRQREGVFLMTPDPPAGQTIAYEYVSNQWAEDAGGTPKTRMTLDTDVTLLDEEVLTLGTIWRFLRGKGLDYSEEMASYERELQRISARDQGSSVLTTTPYAPDLEAVNVPEGDFGV